ncbi:MAG: alpha/beta hydrolase [Chloroflexi bacterium]|nr:alpha/beta hydrolase [Chloroflexota bacterium]MBN9397525.1 alpha/beta hydrolase [Candidatus Melainabacteria bacterium]OJV96492.1 MAG: alpha/beta hydrolase [Chloroflexi bacterium 54-19]
MITTTETRAKSNTVITSDGTSIYYKDWGRGQPVVFSHGWPLNSDIWDEQLFFFASEGYRAIAYDRRGHGRSSQPWDGNDMDHYADDLAELIEMLDLKDVTLVGHSSGGGDVTRYIGRHGTARISKAVLVDAVPPLMLKTPHNPGGIPIQAFDANRQSLTRDRSQFYKDTAIPFYGGNREGAAVSQGIVEQWWRLSMQAGFAGAYDCIKAFSETDFTEDLKKFDVPTLIIHGSDDQFVPIASTGMLSAKLIKNANLKIYEGAPHGLTVTHKDRFNADLLAFLKS